MTLQFRATFCKFLQHLYIILLQHLFYFILFYFTFVDGFICAVTRSWHQYSGDISSRLDNVWNYFSWIWQKINIPTICGANFPEIVKFAPIGRIPPPVANACWQRQVIYDAAGDVASSFRYWVCDQLSASMARPTLVAVTATSVVQLPTDTQTQCPTHTNRARPSVPTPTAGASVTYLATMAEPQFYNLFPLWLTGLIGVREAAIRSGSHHWREL